MSLTPGEKTVLLNEINNDPLNLGYSGKTAVEIATLMNEPGSASFVSWLPSLVPVFVTGAQLLNLVASIDGLTSPLNVFGVGVSELVHWMQTSNDPYADVINYFWDASAVIDITEAEARNIVDYLAGVAMPQTRTLISEAAMSAVLRLGEVLLDRAREILGRFVTEQDIVEALT